MSSMSGCSNYKILCTGGASQPAECLSYLSSLLPTTSAVQANLSALCSISAKAAACPQSCAASSMAGMRSDHSSRRTGMCLGYTLDVLSALCMQDPNNPSCAGWKAWCAANAAKGIAAYCGPASTGAAPASLRPLWPGALAAALAAVILYRAGGGEGTR